MQISINVFIQATPIINIVVSPPTTTTTSQTCAFQEQSPPAVTNVASLGPLMDRLDPSVEVAVEAAATAAAVIRKEEKEARARLPQLYDPTAEPSFPLPMLTVSTQTSTQTSTHVSHQQTSSPSSTQASNQTSPIVCNSLYGTTQQTPTSTQAKSQSKDALCLQNRGMNVFSAENSPEYKTLCCLYSSGVRLHELRSIAEILCQIVTTMKPPNREMKRSFPQLIGWYRSNWTTVSPLLPLIQLRDENGQVINGRRELLETACLFR